jgi:hypothetical protein
MTSAVAVLSDSSDRKLMVRRYLSPPNRREVNDVHVLLPLISGGVCSRRTVNKAAWAKTKGLGSWNGGNSSLKCFCVRIRSGITQTLGNFTEMNPVSTSASINALFPAKVLRNSTFVDTPTTWYSSSALRSIRNASVLSLP